jgi:hypothetical protein
MFRKSCLAVVGALTLAACAKTTFDSSVTEAPAVSTTTTQPTGTIAELLPRLVTEAGGLSDAIANNEHKSEQIALINDLWDAVRPQIEAEDGIAAVNFEGAVTLCQLGAKFNRPADADKCFRNLTALSDSYLQRH